MLPSISALGVARHLHLAQAVQQEALHLCNAVRAGSVHLGITQAGYLRHHLQRAAIETAHAEALLRLFPAANDAAGAAGRA